MHNDEQDHRWGIKMQSVKHTLLLNSPPFLFPSKLWTDFIEFNIQLQTIKNRKHEVKSNYQQQQIMMYPFHRPSTSY